MAEIGTQNGVEQLRALKFLERIVGAIAATDDISAHMQSIVQETTEVTGTQVCSLYLWDAEDEQLTLTATHGLPSRAIGEVKLGVGEGITGWVASHREPVTVADVRHDSRFAWIPGVDDDRYVAMLSMPVMRGEQLYGVLNVQSEGGHVFTDAERDFLATIAAHLASVIEVTGLHRQLALTEALRASEERLRLHVVADAPEAADPAAPVPRGCETIMLVEDEAGVRSLARSVLEECGYAVIEAASAEEALAVVRQYPGTIELLLTDLVLPGQNGRELYEQLVRERPATRALYMSGYTDDVVVRHGITRAELDFLQKPFTPLLLAQTVREALDSPPFPRN